VSTDRRTADVGPPVGTSERRKPGRPRLIAGEDSITCNIRLPVSLYDRAESRSRHERRYNGNVSLVMRDALLWFLQRADDSVA
jgi:hypothetical protein